MSNRTLPQTTRHLIEAHNFLSDPQNWTCGSEGWDGLQIVSNHVEPTHRRCLEGAVIQAMGFSQPLSLSRWQATEEYNLLVKALRTMTFDPSPPFSIRYPYDVNDQLGHAETLRLLRTAIHLSITDRG